MRPCLAIVLGCVGAAGPAVAQFAPPGTGGVVALAEALQGLGVERRVLVIGAHPDDENTALLTLVARGLGGRAAYLSLTRGEGGQNLIGPELGVGLGLIRSEELLAARAVDGAEQFFTRAYDFGYSKSADEAFGVWPHDSLLADVIAVIRRFRPHVIASVFWGTPRDGHGQHQVAGALAHEAYRALLDSAWGPAKLYRSARSAESATLTIPVGLLDPLMGRSYAQLAAASRSRHRSQDMGQLLRPGPAAVRLILVDRRVPGPDTALFAGVEGDAGDPRFAALIDSARARLDAWHPAAVLPYLLRARRLLRADAGHRSALLDSAVAMAAGVVLDAVTADRIVAAGEPLDIEADVWNAGSAEVRVEALSVEAPTGWTVTAMDGAARATVERGAVLTRRFTVSIPPEAGRTEPYFLRRPVAGAMYDWTGVAADVRGRPFSPPLLELRARITVDGVTIDARREVVYRYRDQAIGEVRRPVFITRPFEVAVSPELVVWPLDGDPAAGRGALGTARPFTVTVTNRARGAATARVQFTVPDGWRPMGPETLRFEREDETRTLTVTLQAPPAVTAGDQALGVSAVGSDGRASEGALMVIDYPHIRPRAMAVPSRAEIRVARIALPDLRRVGYVRGASDRVPEELRAIGVPIVLLTADSLAGADLTRYDAILIGSRAYETEPALVANNERVLEYARGGGLVIVQYQQYQFVDGGFAPYPLTMARPHDRVTDERAAVTALAPDHPVLHAPNEIGPRDWDGWVQERGLYFASTWDSAYVPVLEMADPGDAPLRGGLLIAPLGQGTYVYTGLAFFRQLPAGVPGAYRLLLNLLGLKDRHVP